MSGQDVLAGLSDSAFLGDVDDRDRDVGRIVGSVMAGLGAGLVAAIVATVILMVGFVFATGAAGHGPTGISGSLTSLMTSDVHDANTAVFVLLLPALTNGPLALAFIALVALILRHRFMDYVTQAAKLRWRLMFTGLVLCALMMTPLVLAERLFDPQVPAMPLLSLSHDIGGRLFYLGAVIVLLIPAAAAEEILFRGWLLRQTGAFLKNPIALMLINGVVFSALHFDFQPDSFLIRMLMGAGFTYMTLRLGGIEFSTGAHAANNILIVLFLEPLTLRPAVSSGFSILTFAEMATLAIGSVAITETVVRVDILRRWTGLRQEDLAAPRSAMTAESFA